MLESCVTKLDSDSEHIKTATQEIKCDVRELRRDSRTGFRVLVGAMIVVALGLAGIMAKGFHWL